MTDRLAGPSPRLTARLAGLFYLLSVGVGAFDHLVVGRGIARAGDAAATANNLMASEHLYRLACALDLAPIYVIVTVLLYQLFKPVNRTLSLLAAASSLVGGAVGSAITAFQLAPLIILGGASEPLAFSLAQRQALAQLMLNLHELGFLVSLVFFGFYCVLIGWLIMMSRFIPRVVGLLMALGGAAYMTYGLSAIIAPVVGAQLAAPTLLLGSLGEIVLTLWLLAVGLDPAEWRRQTNHRAAGLA